MNKVYLITGPAGVGKSTISNKIAKKLNKSVLIEGDDIYHQVVSSYQSAWMEGNHLEVFWKNVVSLINNYLDYGYDVVFNYIITKQNYDYLKDNIKKCEIIFKVLLVSEEELLRRDFLRSEENRMKDRCIILLRNFKEQKYDINFIIDTTNLNVDEVVKEVMYNEH